ncbi:MAG TPA: peptidylprolyl isomerase [Stellaceae bacterium]|jgi:peptidyl-prolyl cis-trans isomerase C
MEGRLVFFIMGLEMISRVLIAAAFALALAGGRSAAAAESVPTPPPASAAPALPPGNPVVARVDGKEFHLADIEAAQKTLPAQAQKLPLAQLYPILLDRLVDGELIAEAARKAHLDQDPAVEQNVQQYRDRLIQRTYLEHAIGAAETEDKLKARYQTYVKDQSAQEEVRARHILVKTEAEAKSIIAQLDKGADFATLAKKYSTDPGAASGGDLGYFTRADMVPEFTAIAFALPKGQYTKTPVKTEFGWHVILVEDHRTKKPPTFEEARADVSRLVAREVVEAKLKELRQGAKVETFGLDGKPMPPQKQP